MPTENHGQESDVISTCAYCEDAPASSVEHLFPAAFGRFPGFEPRAGVLCAHCNERFGRLMQPLFERGAYSLVRRSLPWAIGRDDQRRRGANYELPRVHSDTFGSDIHLEVDRGATVARPTRQLVFENAGGTRRPWIPPLQLTCEEDLRAALRRSGLEGQRPVAAVGFDPIAAGWLRSIFEPTSETPVDPVVVGSRVETATSTTIDFQSLRAHAMIAFHVAVGVYGVDPRREQFAALRAFIGEEVGNAADFVSVDDAWPAHFPIGGGLVDPYAERVKHLFHIALTSSGEMLVALRLFFSGRFSPPWFTVRVARRGIVMPEPGGLALVYYASAPAGGVDGESRRLSWGQSGLRIV